MPIDGTRGYREAMTAQTVHTTTCQPKLPAKTLGDTDRVIRANAPDDVVAAFQAALDAAWSAARRQDALQPMLDFVDRWWPDAVFWSDPEEARRIIALAADAAAHGRPAGQKRVTREDVITRWEAKHGEKLGI